MTRPSIPDPLYRTVRLDHTVVLPVLGVPISFFSNVAEGIEAAEESFGIWRQIVPAPAVGPGVRVRIIQHGGSEGGRIVPVTWRMPDSRHIVGHTPGSFGVADMEQRDVYMYVTPELLADRLHFCHGMLEALTLTTVNTLDRSPLHAAALARGDTVMLLSGPSGSGKSTLAYAAVRHGFDLVSDDAVYLQLNPEPAIWGVPTRVRLLPETRTHFPELNGLESSVLANGKTKLLVPANKTRMARVPLPVARLAVVLLERGKGSVRLSRADSSEIRAELTRELEATRELFGPEMERMLDWVVAAGAWRLHLSANPLEAIPLIEKLFREVEARDPGSA
jgi:hypothetical protein